MHLALTKKVTAKGKTEELEIELYNSLFEKKKPLYWDMFFFDSFTPGKQN